MLHDFFHLKSFGIVLHEEAPPEPEQICLMVHEPASESSSELFLANC